jgi:hypothetical protein
MSHGGGGGGGGWAKKCGKSVKYCLNGPLTLFSYRLEKMHTPAGRTLSAWKSLCHLPRAQRPTNSFKDSSYERVERERLEISGFWGSP